MITQINRTGYPREMVEKHVKSANASNSQLFHIYECEDCVLTFAVEQAALKGQLFSICCPICQDENIRDVSSEELTLRR
jgi:Zn finger protein HypA/HybF involved in hydrogenase expression